MTGIEKPGIIAPLTTLALLLAAAPAFGGNCHLGLNVSNVNLVWNTSLPTQQINFTVTKQKTDACDFVVTFSKGGAGDYNRRMTSGASTLNYQLYKESSLTNILKDAPDVTSANDAITGSFGTGANQSQSLTYFLQIPYNLATSPRLKLAGTYLDSYVVSVFNGTASSGLSGPDQTAGVSLSTEVPRNVQLSLVCTGAGFDPNSTAQSLDFGTLTENAVRTFDIRILTNAGFSVTFASQNQGVLRHTSPDVRTTIPYAVTVNSAFQNLTNGPVVVATGSGQTTTSGTVNPVSITIGSLKDEIAGNYSDNITVTVATTE
ncbi:MAG: spore coat protein U domain-containing protein [Deltaproteobacteria bacterium]|nr:spore coat protein U domain-containing protein [Deltaproteobacteria bacterium]